MLLSHTTLLTRHFDAAFRWEGFLDAMEPGHRPKWLERHGQLALDDAQSAVAATFVRPMRALCLTGPWCGDCAHQGAAMQRVAEAAPAIDLRFLPRVDDHAELIVAAQINAGFRVPVTWLMAEDGAPCARFGDRTLGRYRSMARRTLGDDAVIAPAPSDPVRAVLQEVLDEFERVQLMLRISPRWREKYGD